MGILTVLCGLGHHRNEGEIIWMFIFVFQFTTNTHFVHIDMTDFFIVVSLVIN